MKGFFLITRNLFFFACILAVLFVGSLARPPVFGKAKFILLNTFHYNKYFIDKLESHFKPGLFIRSDTATEYTLRALFGIQSAALDRVVELGLHKKIKLSELVKPIENQNAKCIVNLKGFPETWVPVLTGHWDPIISDTSQFYEHDGYRGKKLAIILESEFKDKCIVYKDEVPLWENGENFRYNSPNLNYLDQQQGIHILKFRKVETGRDYTIFIDTGFVNQVNEKLLRFLALKEIYQIDEIFISHPHKDHYSGLYELLKFEIPIKKVWMNLPNKKTCDKELPWGCDYSDILNLRKLMGERGIEIKEIIHEDPKNPIIVYQDPHNSLSILYASDEFHPEIGQVDINDMSLVMKLSTNGTDYLFTGDMGWEMGGKLQKFTEQLNSDILKVPHHGTEGIVPNEFFDSVDAKIGIVPSPQALWCSERSARIRDYFAKEKTRMLISGFHGDIIIRHFDDGKYQITTEYEPSEICGKTNEVNLTNADFEN